MHLSTKQTAVIYYQRDNYTERKAEALALPWIHGCNTNRKCANATWKNFQFIYLIQPRLSMDLCPYSENPGISHLPSTTSSTVAVLSCMLTTVPAILAAVPPVLAPVAAIAAVARVNRLGLRRSRRSRGSGSGARGVGFLPTLTCGGGDIRTAGGT